MTGIVLAGQEARIARMALHHTGGALASSLASRFDGWHRGERYALTGEQAVFVLLTTEALMEDTVTAAPRIWREAADLHETIIARMERTNR